MSRTYEFVGLMLANTNTFQNTHDRDQRLVYLIYLFIIYLKIKKIIFLFLSPYHKQLKLDIIMED